MQYGFFFDQTRCVGCFTCCVACKDWNDTPAGKVSWLRVRYLEGGGYPSPFVAWVFNPCYHCENPSCLEVCPADAIKKKKENGIVTVDPEECLGEDSCGACLEACPYGVPQFGEGEENPPMQKCDLCLERVRNNQKPICVDACPMRALDAGPMAELRKQYGKAQEAPGFAPSAEIKPSIIIKPKKTID